MSNDAYQTTTSATQNANLSFSDWARKHQDTFEQRKWRKQREKASQKVLDFAGKNPLLPIFSYTHAPGLRQSRHADQELAVRIKRISEALDETGLQRPLRLPAEDFTAQLQQAAEQFPNFKDVLERAVAPHLHMLHRGIRMAMAPILLVGPAGIGKTAFARRLAKLCNVPAPLFISIAEEDNGSALIGSSTYWSNTQPGKLFSALAWGTEGTRGTVDAVANPVIVLDEIDKVPTSREKHGADSLGSLYRLLETETSQRVQDRCLTDVLIDASHVRYIATANSIDDLPAPLLSRLDVFHIQPPNATQRAEIAQQMVKTAIQQLRFPVSPVVSPEILENFQEVEPRQLQSNIRKALAFAVMSNSPSLTLEHWRLAIDSRVKSTKLAPGFISRIG